MLYPCIHPCKMVLMTVAIICVCRSMSTVLSALAWCGAGGWWEAREGWSPQQLPRQPAPAPAWCQHQHSPLLVLCPTLAMTTASYSLSSTESAEFLGYPDAQPLIPRTVINAPAVRRGDMEIL